MGKTYVLHIGIIILLILAFTIFGCGKSETTETNRTRQLVRQWGELYAAGRDKEACDLYAENVRFIPAIAPGDVIMGRQAMLQSSLAFRKSEPNYTMKIKEIIADNDRVVMLWSVTFSKGDIECLGLFRLTDGRITELQEYYTGDGFRLFGGVEPVTEQK